MSTWEYNITNKTIRIHIDEPLWKEGINPNNNKPYKHIVHITDMVHNHFEIINKPPYIEIMWDGYQDIKVSPIVHGDRDILTLLEKIDQYIKEAHQ